MLKAISGIALLAFGMLASADDFILRFEHGSYHKEDRIGGKLDNFSEQLHLVASEGVVKELLEVQIRTAERFYARTRVGRTEIEIRGELKAPDETGRHKLKIRTRVTDFTGGLSQFDGKIVESSNSFRSEVTRYITVAEPLWICDIGTSPEPKVIVPLLPELDHNVLFVTLEPAVAEE